MVLGKLKFIKMSKWIRKTQAFKHNWCLMQSLEIAVKDAKKFIQTVCSGKE